MTEKTISILGEEWRIKYQTAKENKELKNCDGYKVYKSLGIE